MNGSRVRRATASRTVRLASFAKRISSLAGVSRSQAIKRRRTDSGAETSVAKMDGKLIPVRPGSTGTFGVPSFAPACIRGISRVARVPVHETLSLLDTTPVPGWNSIQAVEDDLSYDTSWLILISA